MIILVISVSVMSAVSMMPAAVALCVRYGIVQSIGSSIRALFSMRVIVAKSIMIGIHITRAKSVCIEMMTAAVITEAVIIKICIFEAGAV